MLFRSTDFQWFSAEQFTLKIRCSKGTYIRSIAHDLGQALGTGGYLTGLRRTKIGAFQVEDAWSLTQVQEQFDAIAPPDLLS